MLIVVKFMCLKEVRLFCVFCIIGSRFLCDNLVLLQLLFPPKFMLLTTLVRAWTVLTFLKPCYMLILDLNESRHFAAFFFLKPFFETFAMVDSMSSLVSTRSNPFSDLTDSRAFQVSHQFLSELVFECFPSRVP